MLNHQVIDAALAQRSTPLPIFVRNDDGGWHAQALQRLLERCADAELPLDVAVIPAAADADLASMFDQARRRGAALRFHQHGYRHQDHQREGRKCEFGTARTAAEQAADISAGMQTLQAVFGHQGDAIFTPPWNRCDASTLEVLAGLGFELLSRDCTAAPLPGGRVRELPIHIDWQRRRNGAPMTPEAFSAYVARALREARVCGVMLHHATITDDETSGFLAFARHLRSHAHVRFVHMQEAANAL